MSLIGKKAPLFEADAVINGNEFVEKFTLEQFIGKRYVIFFFYPMDFTTVCPTELLSFQQNLEEFEKRNCAVVACSVDSKFSHLAWLNTEINQGGIKGVTYPIIADYTKTIAINFGVFAGDYDHNEDDELTFEGMPVAYRGLFIIDKQGVIRHQLINDLPIGRSIEEVIRTLDALKHFEKYGELCPADWHKGDNAIKVED
ncbi:MAG: peroxiredoxin [Bacteroidales bacterium]|nr:peroxiredoxin [Bacteroidales bacterium]